MKVITIAGTRPELIRLGLIIKKLDDNFDNVLIYTNQNYDKNLSTIFFDELEIRNPDYYFKAQSSLANFIGNSMIEFEKILKLEKPDKILILGDTNSGLLSILANKYNIPVYHMEAGNRCYNDKVPEETNRRIIDHVSKYNLPYTENSRQNLLTEGFNRNFVLKTGNPINEVLIYYKTQIDNSTILEKLNIDDNDDYILVTCHRAENVEDDNVLGNILEALNEMAKKHKIIFSVHPRTKKKISNYLNSNFIEGVDKVIMPRLILNDNILLSEPFGFFDFIKLEKNANIIITDSGTIQEEGAIFNVPTLVIRDSTERQELIECGSSILCGTKYENIMLAYQTTTNPKSVILPIDYTTINVSDTIINILLSSK